MPNITLRRNIHTWWVLFSSQTERFQGLWHSNRNPRERDLTYRHKTSHLRSTKAREGQPIACCRELWASPKVAALVLKTPLDCSLEPASQCLHSLGLDLVSEKRTVTSPLHDIFLLIILNKNNDLNIPKFRPSNTWFLSTILSN